MKSKSKRKPAKAARKPKAANGGESKRELCKALLTRASGCTGRELLDATGWPTISVPATAKACGLKLRTEKNKGQPTQYFGTAA